MDTDCLFCGIASGEISASVVAETPRAMAFRDISPQAPVHVVVIPKDHHPDVAALSSADPDLAAEVLVLASQVAQSEGLDSGFRVVFNSGSDAGQSVFHVHAHVLGGRSLGWPPG
ncbi:MAG: histidine triad nucleotide-binding protein [Actinomycetes bacterium]